MRIFSLRILFCVYAWLATVAADQIAERLMNWFVSGGGMLDGVEVHTFEGMGRGLRAVRDLRQKHRVLSVPFELCITRETVLTSATGEPTVLTVFKTAKSDEDLIAMFLLRERALGNTSDWEPYLNSLPRNIIQGSEFNDEVLTAIQDPIFARAARDRGRKIVERFEKLKPNLDVLASSIESTVVKRRKNGDSYAEKSSTDVETTISSTAADVSSISAFRWALAVVSSRALTFRGKRYLAPITDMFNYAPHPNKREAASGAFYLEHHVLEYSKKGSDNPSKGTLHVYADRATPANNQLFEDYGDNTNSLYLDHHGFVPEYNPFDCINLPFNVLDADEKENDSSDIRENAKNRAARLQALKLLGVPANPVLCLRNATYGAEEQYPWTAYVWLTVMEMTEDTLNSCLEQLQTPKARDKGTLCPVIPSNPRTPLYMAFPPKYWEVPRGVARKWILPAVNKRISSFPTTLADDAGALEDAEETLSSASEALSIAIKYLEDAQEQPKKLSRWNVLKKLKFGSVERKLEDLQTGVARAESNLGWASEVLLAIKYRIKQKELLNALKGEIEDELAPYNAIESVKDVVKEEKVEVTLEGLASSPTSKFEVKQATEFVENTTWTDYSDCREDNVGEQSLACAVAVFNAWLSGQDLPVAKLKAQVVPGMRIGAVATENIAPEELYLSVPLRIIMDSHSARRSSPLLNSGIFQKASRLREADFFVLLFHLMYEYEVLGDKSFYWPYLRLLPQLWEIKPPCEYDESEMKLLEGSDVHSSIMRYRNEVQRHWRIVRGEGDNGFGDEVAKLFNNKVNGSGGLSEETFRWAHYVLNSRSIWWNGMRHLVPLLDLINCKEGPENPERVHATRLDDAGKNADTLAPWAFKKGEQVFENYGQPNHIYFQYHGFVIDENTHDCVSVGLEITKEDAQSLEGGINSMRRTMVQNRFNAANQNFCIANPLILQEVAKKISSSKVSTKPILESFVEPRLLAFLAIKHGKPVGSDVRNELRDFVATKLASYPSHSAADINAAIAGEGIGGGSGESHPALKLVGQEKELLRMLLNLL